MKRSKHITLDDLPPKYREQAERQMEKELGKWRETAGPEIGEHLARNPNAIHEYLYAEKQDVQTGKESLPVRKDRKPKRPHRQPNKTEARFNMEMLGNKGEYEAVSFRTPAGRYTPDFCVWDDEGRLTCYEVKGGYRMNSQQAARRAFLDTADRFKHVTFKWYKKTKSGWEEWYGQTN